ncbi:endonuclease/exonuclease/phosphatase family protein [Sphingobacterium sp. HJSM2_6]|uniref:endonuclease/exonuclease/phosphatase family protein n=1 Tax=Sphingobacterium sp. HJSM2_6 TaxID=3366264 RepID=UPI003BCF4D27
MKNQLPNTLSCILILLGIIVLSSCGFTRGMQASKKSIIHASSYNIRYNGKADVESGNGWDIRKFEVAKLIQRHGFDMVGTQEGDFAQMKELNSLMPEFKHVAKPYGGKTNDIHTCSILYKDALFELLDEGVFWLSQTADVPSIGWDATDQRICQWAKFKIKESGKIFYFFNAHFYYQKKEARLQSGALMVRKMKEIAGDHSIICTGDFNSTVEKTQIKQIKAHYLDAYDVSIAARKGVEGTNIAAGVFTGPSKGRIDFVFISKDIQVLNYEVYSDVYDGSRYPSDHLPVGVTLKF